MDGCILTSATLRQLVSKATRDGPAMELSKPVFDPRGVIDRVYRDDTRALISKRGRSAVPEADILRR